MADVLPATEVSSGPGRILVSDEAIPPGCPVAIGGWKRSRVIEESNFDGDDFAAGTFAWWNGDTSPALPAPALFVVVDGNTLISLPVSRVLLFEMGA